MAPMEPAPAPAPPAAPPRHRSGLLRIAVLVLLGGAVAAAGWLALGNRPTTATPEGLCRHVIAALHERDADAAWMALTDSAREKYADFVRIMRERADTPQAAEMRRLIGVSKEDYARLTPRELMALEIRASPHDLYRNVRIRKVEMLGPGEALAHLVLRDGMDRVWLLRKVDEGWKIQDLTAVVNPVTGQLLTPRPK